MLRPPILPQKYGLKLKVILNWRYIEILCAANGWSKMEGIVKWGWG